MRPLTPWGLEVRKRLLERNMTIEELAITVGAKSASYIRDVLYGFRPGNKYRKKIEVFLDMENASEKGAAANE